LSKQKVWGNGTDRVALNYQEPSKEEMGITSAGGGQQKQTQIDLFATDLMDGE
jgi:hypothetical protein